MSLGREWFSVKTTDKKLEVTEPYNLHASSDEDEVL